MALALTSLASAAGMGYVILHRLFVPKLSLLECGAGAAPLGFTLSAWLALLLKSTVFQSTHGIPAILVVVQTLLQCGITVYLARPIRMNKRFLSWSRSLIAALAPLLALVAVLSAWFTYIFYTHSLLMYGEGYHVGGSTYGDMPFHLNIINSFLHGVNAEGSLFEGFRAVFFADAKLVYPIIPDWHTAVLIGAGASYHTALFTVGVCLVSSFLLLLLCFNLRLTGSGVASGGAVILTLLCGGIGGFVWLFTDFTIAGLFQVDHILYVVNNGPASILWLSLPAHILLPQRTTQYAYPIALLSLILLLRGYNALGAGKRDKSARRESEGGIDPAAKQGDFAGQRLRNITMDPDWDAVTYEDTLRLFAGAGLIAGLLPLLQAHSYVAIAMATVSVGLIHVGTAVLKPTSTEVIAAGGTVFKVIELWLAFGLVAIGLGAPQLWLYSGKVSSHKRFARFEGVWVDQHEPGPHTLWPEALGLFVPLNIAAFFLLSIRRTQLQFHIGLFVVFFVSNIVVFQPWEVDNTKLFYIWVFGASGQICQLLEKWWFTFSVPTSKKSSNVKPTLARIAVALVFGSLILSGSLCMIGETVSFSEMFDVVDEEAGNWYKDNTPTDARIATTSEGTHMRPESALAGRQVLVGYPGWMDSHGMPWPDRNRDLMDLFKGKASLRASLLKYNITHITVDWAEVRRDSVNIRRLNAHAYRVASNGRYVIYQVPPQNITRTVIDCMPGALKASEADCSAKGCEWVEFYDGPWCQVPPVRLSPSTISKVGGPPISDCGRNGITKPQCEDMGCSWYEGYATGPWCHHPVTPPDAPADVATRHGLGGMVPLTAETNGNTRDCGWSNITPGQCFMRGCKWTPYVRGPWCTFA